QEFELGFSLISLFVKLYSLTRQLNGDRNQAVVSVIFKIISLENERQVGERPVQGQSFFELPIPLGLRHSAELFRSEVSGSMLELQTGTIGFHANLAELPVLFRIR